MVHKFFHAFLVGAFYGLVTGVSMIVFEALRNRIERRRNTALSSHKLLPNSRTAAMRELLRKGEN